MGNEGGRKPSPQELQRILARHRGWLANPDPPIVAKPIPEEVDRYFEPAFPEWRDEARLTPERASLRDLIGVDLSNADLTGAELTGELTGANLSYANLSYANLSHANLNGAKLIRANLSSVNLMEVILCGADLRGADLSGAVLFDADLSRTHLSGANLSGAKLSGAVLHGANLSNAILNGADLSRAHLSGADLSLADLTTARLAYADLTVAIYMPASEPPHPYVAGIRGLSTLRVSSGDEVGLVQLRKLLQDAGLRDLEREATYSIEHARTSARKSFLSVFAGIFRRAAFDWTTAYGLHPLRALFLIMAIWLLCIPVYCWPIARDPEGLSHGSGIYQVFPPNRIAEPAGERPRAEKEPLVLRVQSTHWWIAVPAAAYFSLLSAVNIGFEQFTPGDWIRRLQPHEYALQAEGWVRVVAGVQALLSVFQLAMWALTQFGRPFQ